MRTLPLQFLIVGSIIVDDAAAADCYSEQKISAKYAGVSTGHLGSNNRNWNVHSRRIIKCACILTMAVIAAVLGVHQLVLLGGPSKTRNYDHEHLRTVQVTGADEMQVVSRASTSTYRLPQLFQVGGAGAVWTTPSTTTFFTGWAASISFRSGDVLSMYLHKLTHLRPQNGLKQFSPIQKLIKLKYGRSHRMNGSFVWRERERILWGAHSGAWIFRVSPTNREILGLHQW